MAEQTLDLGFATTLEPENIVSYFNSKGLENTFGWTDMLDKDHAKSFTVAKVMNMDLLQDVRGLVSGAIQEGQTLDDFKKSFMDKMQKKGWWDSDASGEVLGISRRLNTILRTNSQSAYMAGKYNTFAGDVGERPYLQYLAVLDASTRPSHAAMHGKIYRYDDPFWSYFYPPNGFNCFDDQTEVYTSNGWKLFKELDKCDEFLSLNPVHRTLEYVKAIRYFNYEHKGDMVHIKAQNFDLCCTTNHQLLVQKSWDVKQKRNILSFKDAVNIADCDRFYRSCNWAAGTPKFININGIEFNTITFVRFMAMYLSDGSCSINPEGRYVIKIAQESQESRNKFKSLLKEFPFTIWDAKQCLYIKPHKEFAEYLMQFGKCNKKFVPDIIKKMSVYAINEFLETYLLCDGHVYKDKIHSISGYIVSGAKQVFTTSKRLADDLSELVLKAGYVPSLYVNKGGKVVKHKNGEYKSNYDVYIINMCVNQYSVFKRKNYNIIHYEGMVYCVELEKHHTLYVRRNGKPVWAGNCRCHVRSLSDLDIKDMGIDVIDSGDAVSVEEEELDNGNTIKTGVFKLDDGAVFKTDKGWGYNSGKESYDLFFKKYDQDIFDVGQKSINGFLDGYLRTRYPELTLDEISSMRKGFFAALYADLKVSDDVVRAVNQYKGSGYVGINSNLRGYNGDLGKIKDAEPSDMVINNINAMDQLFRDKKIATDRNIKVYRGFGIHKDDIDWDIYKDLVKGDRFKDHGFVSTSYRSSIHKGFAVGTKDYNVYELEINVPKGSKAINIQTFLAAKVNDEYKESEFELLLNRGIEFKVNNVIIIDENHKIIQVDALL